MPDLKSSQLPIGNLTLSTIFPTVTLGVTSQISFNDIVNSLTSNFNDTYITGGTYSNGTAVFTNNTGGTFSVTGFTLDNYSLSDLGFSIKSLPTAIIDRDILLPDDSYVTYQSPLVIGVGDVLTVPPTSIFTVVNDSLSGGSSTSNNISDAIYTVNNNLNANNTTTATTSICIYGVNVFTGVTNTNYATKLPQPVTGKSVKVINNGSTILSIYPSNIGGQINNLPIDTPAIIPADGNLYEFICIVNPMPGAWTYSAPATGQYDSGEIIISLTAGTANGANPWVTAINSTKYTVTKAPFITQMWAYNGKNTSAQFPTPQPSTNTVYSYDYATAFRPDTPWKGITKIKVYTNLLYTLDEFGVPIGGGEIRLNAAGNSDYYDITTGDKLANGENNSKMLFRIYPNNVIAGTAVTGSTKYTSANVGDPGTLWEEKVAFTDIYSDVNLDGTNVNTIVQGTFIGNKTQGQIPFPYSGNINVNQGDIVEKFYSSFISFQFQPLSYENYGTIPDFKFRFIIEYYQ